MKGALTFALFFIFTLSQAAPLQEDRDKRSDEVILHENMGSGLKKKRSENWPTLKDDYVSKQHGNPSDSRGSWLSDVPDADSGKSPEVPALKHYPDGRTEEEVERDSFYDALRFYFDMFGPDEEKVQEMNPSDLFNNVEITTAAPQISDSEAEDLSALAKYYIQANKNDVMKGSPMSKLTDYQVKPTDEEKLKQVETNPTTSAPFLNEYNYNYDSSDSSDDSTTVEELTDYLQYLQSIEMMKSKLKAAMAQMEQQEKASKLEVAKDGENISKIRRKRNIQDDILLENEAELGFDRSKSRGDVHFTAEEAEQLREILIDLVEYKNEASELITNLLSEEEELEEENETLTNKVYYDGIMDDDTPPRSTYDNKFNSKLSQLASRLRYSSRDW